MDAYSILKVSRMASRVEIKAAYRKLALLYHPDTNNNDQVKLKQFRLIQEAYQQLMSNKPNNKNNAPSKGYNHEEWYSNHYGPHKQHYEEKATQSFTSYYIQHLNDIEDEMIKQGRPKSHGYHLRVNAKIERYNRLHPPPTDTCILF